jgi:S1-C subfamily serine protease
VSFEHRTLAYKARMAAAGRFACARRTRPPPRPPPSAGAERPRSALDVGERVFASGSPRGLDHTFTAGIISALRDDYLRTDACSLEPS